MAFSYPNLRATLYVPEKREPLSDLASVLTVQNNFDSWEVLKADDILRVIPYGSRQTLIQWGTIPDLTPNSIIVVQKSDSPEGFWTTLCKKTVTEVQSYLDADSNNTFANHAQEWYRLLVYGANKIVAPVTSMGVADPYGAEIARRHSIRLKEGRSGNLMFLFVRMKEGTRCPRCWDEILQKRVRSDCPDCTDTGWLLGYYDPYPIYVSVGTEKETMDHLLDGPSNTSNKIQAWTSNYPILNNGDVIIEPRTRKIWVIIDREFSTHKRVITKQNLVMYMLDGDDPAWSLVSRIPTEVLK